MVPWAHAGNGYGCGFVTFICTCSYVLTGTEKGFEETFGSTCHGAVSGYIIPVMLLYAILVIYSVILYACTVLHLWISDLISY